MSALIYLRRLGKITPSTAGPADSWNVSPLYATAIALCIHKLLGFEAYNAVEWETYTRRNSQQFGSAVTQLSTDLGSDAVITEDQLLNEVVQVAPSRQKAPAKRHVSRSH